MKTNKDTYFYSTGKVRLQHEEMMDSELIKTKIKF